MCTSSSRPTTPGCRTSPIRRSGSSSARAATAARASTPPSTRRTSPRSPRRSSSTARVRASRGPSSSAGTPHGLSSPAETTALAVLEANGVAALTDEYDDYVPTPALSRAIVSYNRAVAAGRMPGGLADGIVITPSHNPPRDGGFKYNPPHGGPADSDATTWIADRANAIIEGGNREVDRQEPSAVDVYDYRGEYVADLEKVLDVAAIRSAGLQPRRRPARRSERQLLGADRGEVRPRRFVGVTTRSDRGQPARRPDLALHDPGLGRQDPHGPVVAERHGIRRRPPRRLRAAHRQRRRRRPARHRHPRRPHEPQPLSRRRDPLPVHAPGRVGVRMRRSARLSSPVP